MVLENNSLLNNQESKNQKENYTLIQKIEIIIPLSCMILMTIIAFVQVVARYVFGFSFSWAEEINRYLVIWVTFVGSAAAFRMGAHVSVSAMVNILPVNIGSKVKMFSQLITLVFFIILGYFGLVHTINQTINLQVGPATRLPMAIPYSAVPIGSLLVIIYLLTDWFKKKD